MNALKSLALALSITTAVGLPATGIAAPQSTANPAEIVHALPPTTGVLHVVKGVYFNQANLISIGVTANTYAAMDPPTKVKCAVTNGCTILMSNFMQVTPNTSGGNVAICTEVDGNFANNCGNYLGIANVTDGFRGYNDQEYYHVAYGVHTVQTFAFMNNGGTVYGYQFTYTVTTP